MSYVPKYGVMTGGISTPFKAARYDGLSFRQTPIELFSFSDPPTPFVQATGFFWRRGDKSYLVTNHHVVTGLNVFTQQNLHATGFRPNSVRYYRPRWDLNGDGSEGLLHREVVDLCLWRDEASIFLEHPYFEQTRADIAVLEIPALPHYVSAFHAPHVNDYGFSSLFQFIGYDAFVVGYPYRSYVGAMPAIWKRGSYATEPLIPVDGRPMMLLDVATTSGMSGSPVFRRVFGPATLHDTSIKSDAVVTTEFLGVYAGRILSASDGGNGTMGYCWYGTLIDEIIDHGVPVTREHLVRSSLA